MSTWLITGCSTGLGRALAEAVLDAGHNAVVTARDAAKVKDLADAHPDTALAVALDVTDHEQVAGAVRPAEERFGGVDVLVNNAGYGYRAAVEEGEDADVATLFATNFFGPVALIKAVLPGMRAAGAAPSSTSPRSAPGSARPGPATTRRARPRSKACRGSLRKELAPLGITRHRGRARRVPHRLRRPVAARSPPTVIADYAETAGKRRKEHDTAHGTQPGDPARAAARDHHRRRGRRAARTPDARHRCAEGHPCASSTPSSPS